MKKQGTKQLMQDLENTLKNLKTVYDDRNKIIETARDAARMEEANAPKENPQR